MTSCIVGGNSEGQWNGKNDNYYSLHCLCADTCE